MKGFTLIEIMIVIAIIGIIAAIVIPNIQEYRWLHDYEHPERLERWNVIHGRQGVPDSKDCEYKQRLLKQEC